ncbi:hypothetical protein PGTUg99_022878 [Puccinia graminis f. sp. tritici]|uniref:Uncharacterized protein n=1 Tax=Puccinia graminis f. sp. tritici TaxID=56615 RepID=A0A5B0QMA5_PUCGR|nr:hypothetical protein PGTUg99_022878 [Puccinia graminis f. sp. tritici]
MQFLQILPVICVIATPKIAAGPARTPHVKQTDLNSAAVISNRNSFEPLGQFIDDSDHNQSYEGNLSFEISQDSSSNKEEKWGHILKKSREGAPGEQPIKSNRHEKKTEASSSTDSSSLTGISEAELDPETWVYYRAVTTALGALALDYIAQSIVLKNPTLSDYLLNEPLKSYQHIRIDHWFLLASFATFKALFNPFSYMQLKIPMKEKLRLNLMEFLSLTFVFMHFVFLVPPIPLILKSTFKH